MAGYTIPNTPDAFNQNQAEPDSLDFQILGNQKSGVVSGMEVTASPTAQYVVVASGEILINGAYYAYAGATILLTPYVAPPFFDIIYARWNGSTVACYAVAPATGSTNPRFPSSGTGGNQVNINSTDVVLAAVWRTGTGVIASDAITDKRIFVRSSTARTLSDTVSANRGSAADTDVNTSWTPGSTTTSPFSVKVGSTWYNLAYWASNTNIATTGTITAGSFIGNASTATNVAYSGLTGTIPTWNQNTSGNAATATLAAKSSTLSQGGGNGTAMTFNWSGQSGQPAWLWGSNDGSNHYVYNPSLFSVSHATTSTYADDADTLTGLGVNSGDQSSTIVARDANSYITTSTFYGAGSLTHFTSSLGGYTNLGGNQSYIGCRIKNSDTGTNPTAYTLAVSGRAVQINSSGTLGTTSSTRRVKENIKNYENLSVLDAQPVVFDYKEGVLDGDESRFNHVGLIAEDLDDAGLTHLVYKDPDGTINGVAYERLAVDLLVVIKELNERIKVLEAK